jgi:hypothetical protein
MSVTKLQPDQKGEEFEMHCVTIAAYPVHFFKKTAKMHVLSFVRRC